MAETEKFDKTLVIITIVCVIVAISILLAYTLITGSLPRINPVILI